MAAAHYFDDTFSRSAKPANGKPQHHLRRSSTSRSIGRRSSFATSLNGDDGDDGDDGDADGKAVGGPATTDEDEQEREEADEQIASYVADRLERIRSNDDSAVVTGDEFEAQLDD